MPELNKNQQDIVEFEKNRQQLLNISSQKQQLEFQSATLESALAELKQSSNDKVFKIVGPIMIEKSAKDMKKELEDAKESVELRTRTMKKQEDLLLKTLNKLKAKIEASMKKEESKEKK